MGDRARLYALRSLLSLLLLLLLSNIMHTSHVCVTLTSRIYFLLTLAQGKKTAPGWKGTSVVTSVLG